MNWKSLFERDHVCPTSDDAERNGVCLGTATRQNSPCSFVMAMCAVVASFFPRLLKAFVTNLSATAHIYVKITMWKKKKRHATDHPFCNAFSAASFAFFTHLIHVIVQS